LTLPPGAWIDVHAAATAVEQAEAARAAGELDLTRAHASTAAELARRVFLPGEAGPWVEDQRRDLRDLLVRALECLRDVALADGEFGEAVRYAAEITELEPFRESSYRALMQAHAAAGNPAEALRVYERCRRFLADELGAYPSSESEAVYRELLRSSPAESTPAGDDERPTSPPRAEQPSTRARRGIAALVAVVVAAAVTAVVLLARADPPPEVLPNSLVRLDPHTFKPTQVVGIGPRADLVVATGGYVWVAHGSLRYTSDGLRDAGDRKLTRIDPSTGESQGVGGVAPCGLTADPSGDVWVASCYASGQHASVVRVDAKTLEFERTWLFPPTDGYYRGLVYGAGSLWVADVSGGAVQGRGLTQLGPGKRRRSIPLAQHPNALAWTEGYGGLWMTNFEDRSVSRMNPATRDVKAFEAVANNPGALVADGDSVWAGDWNAPDVVRLPAVGAAPPRHVSFPVEVDRAGVTSVAAGAGAIWATVPDDHAVWRIDPKTNRAKRIELGHYPWGVAVDDAGIWVALRAHNT
ncbi:MAG TPA: BTAD domain-containing putative transcriptional regulator, partial [Gaiellaceae bacterium]|nr:BTAD domain-containing putative transcriptional regulator [Gaiellaceae bacterium]